MKNSFFTGVATALVTPFLGDQVNCPMLEQLLRRQLDAGISTIVLCGTTGESATLSDGEKIEIIRCAKAFTGNSARIIAGTGSNSTAHGVSLSRQAEQAGADGLLVVTPYYNKATPEGLLAHYRSICQAVHIPVIAYNVPSRTGLDIPLSLYPELGELPNMAGVKEAATDVGKISRILAGGMTLWAGNDDLALSVISLGGSGVISVLSNVLPVHMNALACAALDGDLDTAAALQNKLLPLMDALFSQINPIPVKAAMALIGYDCGSPRLPLTKASRETRARLEQILKDF